MDNIKGNWWQQIFDSQYLESYPTEQMISNAKDEAKKVAKLLPLKKGSSVLDLCCGYGRHSIEFAKMGYKVMGLDYSDQYIRMASDKAKKERLTNVQFIKGDMRKIPFENKFDAVVNLFSSFGYFEDESDHQKVLNQVSKSLKRGGVFLLDLQNARKWLKRDKNGGFTYSNKYGSYQRTTLPNGVIVNVENDFNLTTLKSSNYVSWIKNGKKNEYYFSMQCFLREVLEEMLKAAYLVPIKTFGNYNGDKYSYRSKRLIILAKKL